VHALLLQGVTEARPPRLVGTSIGLGLAAVAIVLAVGVGIQAIDWSVSLTLFLGILAIALLSVFAIVFAFWGWSCFSLRYVLDRSGLQIVWGPVRHFISIDRIGELELGRGETVASVRGLTWPGHQVGRGEAAEIGPVIFFSTHRSPEDIVYVRTDDVTYGISPPDPSYFLAEMQRLKEVGSPEPRPRVEWSFLGSHPMWRDRAAQLLSLAAIALNLALWGFVFGLYPDLDNQITIEFPPIGDITTLQSRSEILRIPATATVFLATNLLAGLLFQWKERAATYLLVGGAVIFQVAFWIAAIVAFVNA
jgi:hypothetical protein